MPLFFCELCKNSNQIYEKRIMILVNGYDVTKMTICSQCFFKLYRIAESKYLDKNMKQQALDVWNLELK